MKIKNNRTSEQQNNRTSEQQNNKKQNVRERLMTQTTEDPKFRKTRR
jgi:hypothetical protein